jgi:hypothetical protein
MGGDSDMLVGLPLELWISVVTENGRSLLKKPSMDEPNPL